jgi:hypothetical protein
VIAALLAALALALAGADGDPAARLRAAVARAAAGEAAAAVDDLVALADQHPGQPVAAEALAKAAQLREERLHDPAGAVALWDRLLREHPGHRTTRRATARRAELRRGIGGDPAAYAAYRRLIADADLGTEAIARMEELLAGGERSFAREARLWIGDARFGRGELDAARAIYRELAAGDDVVARAAAEGLDRIAAAERRAAWIRRAWMVLAAALGLLALSLWRAAGSWPAAGRALLRLPTEAIYLLPAAAVVAIAAQRGNRMVADAVLWIGAGGVIVTWLSGCALDAERSQRGRVTPVRALSHALVAAVAIGALAYIAVSRDQLVDLIAETVRFGHE